MGAFDRTGLLLGPEAMEKLKNATVAVFGLGGVGGYAVEALARCGVGSLVLVDHDIISESNLNRQLLALRSTIGMPKAEVARRRVLDINPEAKVEARQEFYGPDTAHSFDFSRYDYVVDAIDTVTGKLALIGAAKAENVPILCCLGTGNKLDPFRFRITDIAKTAVCPLARIMRKECARRGYRGVKALWSDEDALTPALTEAERQELPEGRRAMPGSISFVPSVAGLMIAGQVIRDLCDDYVK